jgi:hypothetical protein
VSCKSKRRKRLIGKQARAMNRQFTEIPSNLKDVSSRESENESKNVLALLPP